MSKEKLNVTEVAKMMEISRQTVYNYFERNEDFKKCAVRKFNGRLEFDSEKVKKYMEKHIVRY